MPHFPQSDTPKIGKLGETVDKTTRVADMVTLVSFTLKQLRVFWLAAFLVMAGGQFVHAWEELCCASEHQEHKEGGEKKSCPTSHECCQAHMQSAMDLTKSVDLPAISCIDISSSVSNDAALEGYRPVIEYPPRAS